MKIIVKFVDWLNKRRLQRLKSKIVSLTSEKRVLVLAELLEKELRDNYKLKPDKSNGNLIHFSFYRYEDKRFEIQFLSREEDINGFINVRSY